MNCSSLFVVVNFRGDEICEKEFLIPLKEIEDNFEKLSDMIEQSIDLEKARRDNEYQVQARIYPALSELAKEMKTTMKDIE